MLLVQQKQQFNSVQCIVDHYLQYNMYIVRWGLQKQKRDAIPCHISFLLLGPIAPLTGKVKLRPSVGSHTIDIDY